MAIRKPTRDRVSPEAASPRDREPTPPRGGWSAEAAPTMIIPQGTEIEIDGHGQLSIRAPGNLVLQNSGSYGSLESVTGSIRVDQGVEVEAVSVKAADSCYVQGNLTAWKVKARALQIEENGRAHIVLQETETLEVGREARLVGNFGSEKELFVLFSRFAEQVRSLPFFRDRGLNEAPPQPALEGASEADPGPDGAAAMEHLLAPKVKAAETPAAPRPSAAVTAAVEELTADLQPVPPAPPVPPAKSAVAEVVGDEEFPEPLLFALVLLEREADRKTYGPTSQRALEELIRLLRERDLVTLRHIYRTLFGRVVEPRDDVQRAQELVEEHYAG